ncbi:Serine/threonine-protein kinase PLK4 [Sciurus carolinensis]|uniref:Serine/threonine-protein kinase PLK4 n=1 Tax=Sciurus carolinensis TaxID=30640 RepID=A0AA41MNU1_SCICA|nr:Serine/threonine-protein kinase PLK4 [Sciurus carolinensis]
MNSDALDDATPVNQLRTMKYMTGPHGDPEIMQEEPGFGVDPLSEQSKTRSVESTLGCQKHTLGSITSPLTAHRLKPIRQKTKKAVVSILDSEEVCVELLKEYTSQEYVKEVLQISSDGTMITINYPNDGRGFPLADKPPSPIGNISRYSFDSLPEKYWRKYQYASRFVQLLLLCLLLLLTYSRTPAYCPLIFPPGGGGRGHTSCDQARSQLPHHRKGQNEQAQPGALGNTCARVVPVDLTEYGQ